MTCSHTSLGKALFAHGEFDKAVIELQKAFEIDYPNNKKGLLKITPKLIDALIQLKRRDEARVYYQKAIEVIPDDNNIQKWQKQVCLLVLKGVVKYINQDEQGFYYGYIAP